MTKSEMKLYTMKQYGFGYEVMKEIRICEKCGKPTSSKIFLCQNCGAFLPRKTLFDIYRRRHRYCIACGAILSDAMKYCPKCGKRNSGKNE